MGGLAIAGEFGSPTGQKQMFGRVDPWCSFAVVPMVIVAGFLIWGGIAILGIVLIVLSILIVVIDSWANRPVNEPEDY